MRTSACGLLNRSTGMAALVPLLYLRRNSMRPRLSQSCIFRTLIWRSPNKTEALSRVFKSSFQIEPWSLTPLRLDYQSDKQKTLLNNWTSEWPNWLRAVGRCTNRCGFSRRRSFPRRLRAKVGWSSRLSDPDYSAGCDCLVDVTALAEKEKRRMAMPSSFFDTWWNIKGRDPIAVMKAVVSHMSSIAFPFSAGVSPKVSPFPHRGFLWWTGNTVFETSPWRPWRRLLILIQ